MGWVKTESETETTKSGRKIHHTKSAVRKRRWNTRKKWLKRLALAGVGAHVLYDAHKNGKGNADNYAYNKKQPLKPGETLDDKKNVPWWVNYAMGAAGRIPTYLPRNITSFVKDNYYDKLIPKLNGR